MAKKTEEIVLGPDEEWVWEETEFTGRVPKKGYDEYYIESFCNNPEKKHTYHLEQAGYQGKYLKQEAYRIHNRLREQIEARLDEMILDGAHLGHSTLVEICKTSDSDAVKSKVAKDLMDFAGRKAAERIKITNDLSDEDREAEIERLQIEIREQEGESRKLDS